MLNLFLFRICTDESKNNSAFIYIFSLNNCFLLSFGCYPTFVAVVGRGHLECNTERLLSFVFTSFFSTNPLLTF